MVHAIELDEAGGPEVLTWREVKVREPGPGEIRLRHLAVGVNFIDVYYRKGVYPPPGGYPLIPGAEAAGEVVAVGEGVTGLKPGDRIVYQVHVGAYAEERILPAERAVKLPDGIDPKVAAAGFLKGLTVQCLIRRTFKVEKGQTVLWHAAAGGVGSLATQWLSALGVTVIGTVGDDAKAALARANGCAHVINYRTEDFVARVKEITGGEGVHCVYDSVGKDTFPASLDCLRPIGMFVSFGQSSGLPPPFTLSMLQQKGSLFATRPSIMTYVAKRPDLEASSAELFEAIRSGTIRIGVNQEWPLRDAAEAHRALEARETTGATVLMP
jgi:NADPH2:quinone reductase